MIHHRIGSSVRDDRSAPPAAALTSPLRPGAAARDDNHPHQSVSRSIRQVVGRTWRERERSVEREGLQTIS